MIAQSLNLAGRISTLEFKFYDTDRIFILYSLATPSLLFVRITLSY